MHQTAFRIVRSNAPIMKQDVTSQKLVLETSHLPGTLVTEDMTAQDIERMRENRRRSNNSGTPIYSATQQSRGRGYIPKQTLS